MLGLATGLYLTKGDKMNIYLMTFLFSVITYGLGYYAGNSDGKVEGRMAVRRHYEDKERQFQVNR